MNYKSRIQSLSQVAILLNRYLNNSEESSELWKESWDQAIQLSQRENSWFIERFQKHALQYWANILTIENLENWLSNYTLDNEMGKTVGLVLAGNIPMVGLHDVLSVLLSGNKAQIKLSSKDQNLIPLFLEEWKALCPEIEYEFVERLKNFDKVIATGTNNTARYFEYYFKNVPNIIRNNRTSVAVLEGNETKEELNALADDMALYFGLGCRNVTQLWVPEGYDLNLIFNALFKYEFFTENTKYYNSYEYYKAIYMLNKDVFWDNNFMLLKQSVALFSPIATVNFSYYSDLETVRDFLEKENNNIQCVASNLSHFENTISFGEAQNPGLDTYADNIDVMQFLTESES